MKRYCYDNSHVLATTFSHSIALVCNNVKEIMPHQYTILADFITLPQLVIDWDIATSMPRKTLVVVPHGGYSKGKCSSLKANNGIFRVRCMRGKVVILFPSMLVNIIQRVFVH